MKNRLVDIFNSKNGGVDGCKAMSVEDRIADLICRMDEIDYLIDCLIEDISEKEDCEDDDLCGNG